MMRKLWIQGRKPWFPNHFMSIHGSPPVLENTCGGDRPDFYLKQTLEEEEKKLIGNTESLFYYHPQNHAKLV